MSEHNKALVRRYLEDESRTREEDGGDRARRHTARRRSEHRLRRAIEARRELVARRGAGRAWLNGREVSGTAARHAHLEVSHD